jgi:hypothetical protein
MDAMSDAGSVEGRGEAIRAVAEELGWLALYDTSEPFRERFGDMYDAVEALPAHLIERGRMLGYPQLHWACVAGDIELVDALLVGELPADAYTFTDDEMDEPPLVWLAQDTQLTSELKIQVAQVLLRRGADVNEGSAVVSAVDGEDADFETFLRAHGALD